ncbi:esterase-like activity of phytase family protein [Rhodobacteraceae bacterium N5(2021)]|uniref:Esterase-like activity of phytase family protein n=1 Tax=Gymnodinialimonas phycosphaerae TaxID=2841589 RepID=A0A975YF85_9RHOB|nr:esterase-like activity of phytase family protein [Gymnodinialimonas phycosphaerae]MBY4894404.1 esterase-like activity of phytase family protein [Gymnodinialimonas phycosphaerae]
MSRIAQRVLIAALVALILAPAAIAQATFVQEVRLTAPGLARFGGISAVEVMNSGATALVLSDRGTLFTLSLTRGPAGVTAASVCCAAAITWYEGVHLPGRQRDSEGLARRPDGTLAISFEGGPLGRVAYHRADGVQISVTPPIAGAEDLPRNGGFEGLAIDTSGRLYTLPEDMPGDGPIPLLRLDRGAWQVFAQVPRAPGWSPVALDFDDQGRLYLLQRRTVLPLGFAARLTRYTFARDGGLVAERVLQTGLGRHGNLEGLSLWRDATGRLIATMVSDDDFMPLRATNLVEYALPD